MKTTDRPESEQEKGKGGGGGNDVAQEGSVSDQLKNILCFKKINQQNQLLIQMLVSLLLSWYQMTWWLWTSVRPLGSTVNQVTSGDLNSLTA